MRKPDVHHVRSRGDLERTLRRYLLVPSAERGPLGLLVFDGLLPRRR